MNILKKIILMTVIFSSSCAFAIQKKHIGFIIQKNENFSMKWDNFDKPEDYVLVLITSSNVNKIKDSGTVFDYVISQSDFDEESIDKICQEISKKEGIPLQSSYFVTQDEYALEICAFLREKYKASGDRIEVLTPYRNKFLAKEMLKNSGVKLPKYIKFDYRKYTNERALYIQEIVKNLGFPMFAKPIDEARCKDVNKIENLKDLEKWAENVTPQAKFEIDEFLNGDLYTAMMVIKDGKIALFGAHKFLYPCFEFLNQKKPLGGYTLPNQDPDTIALKALANKILKLFPLSDGVAHVEFMKRNDTGEFVFIEAAARQPGGYISDLFEKRLGMNLGVLHYSLQMKINVNLKPRYRYFVAWYWPNKPHGQITLLTDPVINSQYEVNYRVYPGEKVNGSEFLGDSPYRLLLWNKSLDKLKNDLKILENKEQLYKLK